MATMVARTLLEPRARPWGEAAEPLVLASELAAAQDGLVTRRQALDVGLSRGVIRHLLGRGRRWQRVLPGVYATFTGPLPERQRLRAALLHAGPQAQLTGVTACRARGARYLPVDDGTVHVLVPASVRVTHVGFVKVDTTTHLPRPHWHAGLPLTPVARSCVDAARDMSSLRDVRAALCEVTQRGWTTPERIAGALAQGHKAGGALPRRALADLRVGCRSAPECDLADIFRTSKILPPPIWNRPVGNGDPAASGRGLGAIVPDARWPQARLIVEVDSREWHAFGDAPLLTEARRTRLVAMGWTVISVSPLRLRDEPDLVRAEIEAAYLVGVQRSGGAVDHG